MSFQLPEERLLTQYVKFEGGIDLETPVLSLDPGALLDGMNYQPGLFGGYERLDAFERYDGRAAPSDAVYYYAPYTKSAAVLVGQSVTGTTSGATGVVALVTDTEIVLTKVSGTFVSGETFKTDATGKGGLPLLLTMTYGAATVIGTFTDTPTVSGYAGAEDDAIATNAAADIYRADVSKVPGVAGPVTGLWLYKGVLYAFRYAGVSGGIDTDAMWKATLTGWQKIDLGEEIYFTAGTDLVLDADTLTQGAATATIARVVQTTSAEDPARVGRLILTSRTGNFTAGPATTSSGGTLTLSGASVQLSIPSGGRYEFDNYNFSGSTDTLKMYGCNGGGPAFEFDGTTFVPIRTGMAVDTPSHIRGHKLQLFLSFHGSVQNSGAGYPYIWTTVVGANEIGAGDDITGFSVMPGEALAIAARNSLKQLNGSTVDDFVEKNISSRRGAIPFTVQEMGQTYCLDDQGIVQITPTNYYGNFADNIVSRKVQPLTDALRDRNIYSSAVYRTRNQYRIYASNGTGMILAVGLDKRGNPSFQITEFDYNAGRTTDLINPYSVCAGEDDTGKDVVFFGGTNGYVYQCEKGTSFDGNDIEAYLRLPFGDAKSPRILKHYKKAALEMASEGFTSLRFHPEFSYGNPSISTHQLQTQSITGHGAYWGSNAAVWSQFFYDVQSTQTPEFKIGGSGTNISLLFYSRGDYYASHKLDGAIIHYTQRRIKR